MNCPNCNFEITDTDIRCPSCALLLTLNVTTPPPMVIGLDHSQPIRARQHPDYILYTFVTLLIPSMGFLYGLALLTKSSALDKKMGVHMLLMSVLGLALWIAFSMTFLGNVVTE